MRKLKFRGVQCLARGYMVNKDLNLGLADYQTFIFNYRPRKPPVAHAPSMGTSWHSGTHRARRIRGHSVLGGSSHGRSGLQSKWPLTLSPLNLIFPLGSLTLTHPCTLGNRTTALKETNTAPVAVPLASGALSGLQEAKRFPSSSGPVSVLWHVPMCPPYSRSSQDQLQLLGFQLRQRLLSAPFPDHAPRPVALCRQSLSLTASITMHLSVPDVISFTDWFACLPTVVSLASRTAPGSRF